MKPADGTWRPEIDIMAAYPNEILNPAVGNWTADPDASTPDVAVTQIDYVRAWA